MTWMKRMNNDEAEEKKSERHRFSPQWTADMTGQQPGTGADRLRVNCFEPRANQRQTRDEGGRSIPRPCRCGAAQRDPPCVPQEELWEGGKGLNGRIANLGTVACFTHKEADIKADVGGVQRRIIGDCTKVAAHPPQRHQRPPSGPIHKPRWYV